MSVWQLIPSSDQQLVLDDSLNVSGLQIRVTFESFSIVLKKLKGFELNSNPFERLDLINYKVYNIWLVYVNGRFNFYSNKTLIQRNICNQNLSGWKLIAKLEILDLSPSTFFSSKLCPFIFKNSLVRLIRIYGLSFSFIETNLMEFESVPAPDLDSKIEQLHLKFFHANLTHKLLNQDVYADLRVLDLNGPIQSIQNDLFQSFKELFLLRLRSQNVRRLFSRNNRWLTSLNMNVNFRVNSLDDVTVLLNTT